MLSVAADEVARAREQMRIPGHPRPYFVSFLIRDEEDWRYRARYGSTIVDRHDRARNGFVDVRVGSHRSDQVIDGGLLDNDKEAESYNYVDLPFGGGADGLRHGLWRLADARYREAVEELLEKRSRELTYQDTNRSLPAWTRREPVHDVRFERLPEVDVDAWRDYVERASRTAKSLPDVMDSHVEFEASHTCTVFVDSDGTRCLQTQAIWSLECYLWLLSPRGDGFPYTIKKTVTDPAELPDLAGFRRAIRAAAARVRELFDAPLLRSFCGPALLDPVPAGLLLHEAIGHRLEGSRLLSTGEGQTFRDALGQRILPEFLTVHDDPRARRFGGRSLVGHYRFDDEGVPAADARLVERGTLVGYLTGRTAVGRRHRSNGHARGTYHRRPTSRMGSLFVEADPGLSDAALFDAFVKRIRDSGAPFGLRVVEASSGETATDAYNFQAFLGEANLVQRVFPDGRKEWVRGLNFVGTPLNAVRAIVAGGKRAEVDNAWCGAESGYVPVSTVSPALLVSELEMQSKPDEPYTAYTFDMPWRRGARGA